MQFCSSSCNSFSVIFCVVASYSFMFCSYFSEVDGFSLEEPSSPSKSLRASVLKRRFADTIAKAQQGTLLDQVLLWWFIIMKGPGLQNFGVLVIA
jgi:hypothetical protein